MIKEREKKKFESIIYVLSHLFFSIYCRYAYKKHKILKRKNFL